MLRAGVRLTDLAKRSRPIVVGYYLQKDARTRWTQRNGVRAGGHGDADVDAYTVQVLRSVFEHLEMGPEDVRGLRVLEIGPGDSAGALRTMREYGAREAVAIDRFAVELDEPGVEFVQVGIEDAADRLGEERFDLIYSIAVLEHVADLEAAFASLYRLLAPGGVMGHQIGGGDHGMFSDGGHHPLTFMTIPQPLWRQMTAHSGGPNRVLPATLRPIVERYDWEWRLVPTNVMTADVAAIRRRLREPFRSLPSEELLIEGSFLTCRAVGDSPAQAGAFTEGA